MHITTSMHVAPCTLTKAHHVHNHTHMHYYVSVILFVHNLHKLSTATVITHNISLHLFVFDDTWKATYTSFP